MGDENNRRAVFNIDSFKQFHDFSCFLFIKITRGFIRKHYLWLMDYASGNCHLCFSPPES